MGIFGSIIETTNVEGILKLDLLATDFYRDEAYPTYLYYNPYSELKEVFLSDGPGSYYELISKSPIVTTEGRIMIPPRSSVVLVSVPKDGEWKTIDGKLLINDVVVDFHH